MTHSDIIRKIRERIDEVGINETVSLNFPIDAFIVEAANQTLMSAPIHLANNVYDFSTSIAHSIGDGSGFVDMPTNLVRVLRFQMLGWKQEVREVTPLTSELLKRQTNKVTRANNYAPIIALDNSRLVYFNVDESEKHIIKTAIAQCFVTDVDDFPIELVDALSWLVASKTLQVMNEKGLSDNALSQYMYIMSTIK